MKRPGTDAEDQAADHLLALGYTIVARRVKTRSGEIDIVALDGDTLVFVEVKSRARGPVTPEEALTHAKSHRLKAAAEEYCHAAGGPDLPARFDLIAIDADGLRHHQSALG